MSQEKDIIDRIASRVKTLRKAQKLTQLDLAVKSDIDPRQIQRIEAGKHDTGIRTLDKVARAFGMSLSDFFDFGK
ncbi:MAG: helix-turn-helix transcriptional regulator [Flavobacteriales bacterium]|jgi:transcriptional regulator with XRE-family HTH domain|nr:helix-turn-helix transcriptional regulator [Flavobacteriales bacterium]